MFYILYKFYLSVLFSFIMYKNKLNKMWIKEGKWAAKCEQQNGPLQNYNRIYMTTSRNIASTWVNHGRALRETACRSRNSCASRDQS